MIQSRISIHPCVLHCIHNIYVLRISDMHSSSSHTQTERSRTSSPPPAPSVRLSVHTFPVVRLLPPVITRCRPSQDKDHRVHIKGRGRITHFLTKWPEPPQPYSPLPPLLALLSPLTTRTSAAGMLSMSRRWGSEVFVFFSSSFYLGWQDRVKVLAEARLWIRSGVQLFLRRPTHWVRWVNACGENILNWNQRAASTIKSLGNCGKIMGSWGDQRIQTKLSSASIQFSDKT